MISLLMLEWWFWLPYRRVWFSCVSLWDKMLPSMFLIFWKRVCLGMRKFVQWRKKCISGSISLPYSHKGSKVSWKHCLNLCSWRWLKPRRNLAMSLIPRRLWRSKILLAQGRMKFRNFFLKVVQKFKSFFFTRLAEFQMLRSSLFHSGKMKEKMEEIKEKMSF